MSDLQLTFTSVGDETYTQEIECGVCKEVWRDPIELQPCGHIFCRTCVGDQRRCPICRKEIVSRSTPNRILVHQAAEQQVRCDRCYAKMPNKARTTHACRPEDFAAAEAKRAAAKVAPPMQIVIKTLTDKRITFSVKSTDTVHSLKTQIWIKEGVETSKQCLIFGGRPLTEGENTLADYNIPKGAIIQLSLPMNGGTQKIFVRMFARKTIALDVAPIDTGVDVTRRDCDAFQACFLTHHTTVGVKAAIQGKEGISTDQPRPIITSTQLDADSLGGN